MVTYFKDFLKVLSIIIPNFLQKKAYKIILKTNKFNKG